MKSGRRRFYWDSSIFIAWLQDERRPTKGEREGIAELVGLIDRDEAILVTSAITRIEVLNSHLNEDQQHKFDQVLRRRRNVQVVACDMRVADKAVQVRDYHLRKGKSIKTPDAIHLATAILYDVDVLYSFDGAGRKPGLIALSGDVAGHTLQVEAPHGERTLLSVIDENDPDVPGSTAPAEAPKEPDAAPVPSAGEAKPE